MQPCGRRMPLLTSTRPLPSHALDALRQRYPEMPTTYAWAGNQGCEAICRFSDGSDRIMIAVENEMALYVVISTSSESGLNDIRAAIGLWFGMAMGYLAAVR